MSFYVKYLNIQAILLVMMLAPLYIKYYRDVLQYSTNFTRKIRKLETLTSLSDNGITLYNFLL